MGGVPGRATAKHSGSDASNRSGSGRQERDKTRRDDWPKECKAKRLSAEPVRHSAPISKKKQTNFLFKFVHPKSVKIKLWYLSSRVLCLQVRLTRKWFGPKCNTQQCKSVKCKLYSWGQATEGSLKILFSQKTNQRVLLSMTGTNQKPSSSKNQTIKLNLRREKNKKKTTHSCFQEQAGSATSKSVRRNVLECCPVQRNNLAKREGWGEGW